MTRITIKEYFATAGSRLTNKDAREIGPVLAEMAEQEEVTVDGVLQAAKSTNCPLHRFFEWNDDVAAHKYRQGQAEDILTTVRVRFVSNDDGQEHTVRAYKIKTVAIEPKQVIREPASFSTPSQKHRDPEDAIDADELLVEAIRDLHQWSLKYGPHAAQFGALHEAVEATCDLINDIVSEYEKVTA